MVSNATLSGFICVILVLSIMQYATVCADCACYSPHWCTRHVDASTACPTQPCACSNCNADFDLQGQYCVSAVGGYEMHWSLTSNTNCDFYGGVSIPDCVGALSATGATFYNNALLLDGFTGSMTVSSFYTHQPSFSVLMYVQFESGGSRAVVLTSADGAPLYGWSIFCDQNMWSVEWGNGVSTQGITSTRSCTTPSADWVYVVFTYDKTQQYGQLWVGGTKVGYGTFDMHADMYDTLSIGCEGKSNCFKGSIRSVSYYNYVVSDDVIRNNPDDPNGSGSSIGVGSVVLAIIGAGLGLALIAMTVKICRRARERHVRRVEHKDVEKEGFHALDQPLSGEPVDIDDNNSEHDGARKSSLSSSPASIPSQRLLLNTPPASPPLVPSVLQDKMAKIEDGPSGSVSVEGSSDSSSGAGQVCQPDYSHQNSSPPSSHGGASLLHTIDPHSFFPRPRSQSEVSTTSEDSGDRGSAVRSQASYKAFGADDNEGEPNRPDELGDAEDELPAPPSSASGQARVVRK